MVSIVEERCGLGAWGVISEVAYGTGVRAASAMALGLVDTFGKKEGEGFRPCMHARPS
jgi:hypothetical protein